MKILKTISAIFPLLLPFTVQAANSNSTAEDPFSYAASAFRSDISDKKHLFHANDANKCPYPAEIMMKAFSKMESDLGQKGLSLESKNWTSLHPTSNEKFYLKWDGKSVVSNGETLRKYETVEKGLYDFIYLYKYAYGCKLDRGSILKYIYGKLKNGYNQQQINHASAYLYGIKSFAEEFSGKKSTEKEIKRVSELPEEPVINAAVNAFLSDMEGLKLPSSNEENRCQYPIKSIARSIFEEFKEAAPAGSNNVSGLKLGSGDGIKWTGGTSDTGPYRKYESKEKSMYDAMYFLKYGNHCRIDAESVMKIFQIDQKEAEEVALRISERIL